MIDDELHIEKADNTDAEPQTLDMSKDQSLHLVRNAESGINADGIAGMDACTLHQLHNAGNEHVLAIADGIYLQLFAADIFIYQHRLIFIYSHSRFQVVPQLLLVSHNLHRPPTEHKTGPHQYRVTDFPGDIHSIRQISHRLTFRLRYIQRFEEFLKGLPVLRFFNGFAIRADDFHPSGLQRPCQVNRRLAAERGDHACRFFQRNHVHDVFNAEGLKVQLVGGGVIGRHRFRIVVDDDRFIPGLLYRLDSMNGGIVELHPLTDPNGTGAEDDHLFLIRYNRLVLVFVRGIEVRDITVELRRATVDHLIYRRNIVPHAQLEYVVFAHAPLSGDFSIRKTHFFRLRQDLYITGRVFQNSFLIDDALQFAHIQLIDLRNCGDLFSSTASA